MRFPGRNQRPAGEPYAGVYGGQVRVDSSRQGRVDDGNIAYDERVAQARRSWPEARREDFEQIDQRGRRFRDKASGVTYARARGAPLLAAGEESTRFISCFFVGSDGYLVFLQPADIDEAIHGPVSYVTGGQVMTGPPAQGQVIY